METWHAVYRLSDGALVSVGTVVADPLPDGLAAVPVDGPPGERTWDGATLAFKAVPGRRVLTKTEYLERFTGDELRKIKVAEKTNADVEVMLYRLQAAAEVRLDNPSVRSAIAGFQAMGILTAARAAEVLADA